ncbi:hypothetical protein M1N23_02925 [Dehalococcoidia bacterium]|nr:hypothetical protein [Dehalococcoidia bacterium]
MGEVRSTQANPEQDAILHLQTSLGDGVDWLTAMLEAMALWTRPEEEVGGRRYNYFIGGEAFDWLALLERLSHEVEGQVPVDELEEVLFTGRFPLSFDESEIQFLLGIDKYRGYLNYFYGVEVESALQQTVETEIEKRYYANGHRDTADRSDEVFLSIYRTSLAELREVYHLETGALAGESITLTELKEFTYWLFKHRLKVSDKAKIASDTRKGLDALCTGGRISDRDGLGFDFTGSLAPVDAILGHVSE